ncbi:MAG: M28 family peptidase [Planctomycetota bacterium]
MIQSRPLQLLIISSAFFIVSSAHGFSQGANADRLPFCTQKESDFLVGEASGDRAYEHVRWYTHWHRPFASEGLMAAAKYTEAQAKEFGLSNVKLTKTGSSGIEWTPRRGELWITIKTKDGIEVQEQICDIGSVQLSLLDRSRSASVTAEWIDVNAGVAEADYKDKDVAGKLVLAWGAPATVMKESVWNRGAAGIVVRPDPDRGFNHPDQVRWLAIPEKSEDGKLATFAFNLSHRQGVAMAQKLKLGKVMARAVVEAETGPGWLVMVEATIPGTDPSLPCVLYTAHLQEERFSANDDASGCANTLELARVLQKGIDTGVLARPRRSLRFWWTTEIQSEDQLFADHPEVAETILCNINQDMTGANQSQGTLRVQNITRIPWSRSDILENVAEEIVNFIVDGNTSQLAGLQAGTPYYPFPVVSKLGTRHRYNARFIPYHANTDHQCFVAPPVGIPALTFTNWPDDYIHTTDDDLWNLDPTQLQRNALAAAAIGYTIARAGEGETQTLTFLARGHASRRFGEATNVAMQKIRSANDNDRAAALRDANSMIRASVLREQLTLKSISRATGAPHAMIDRALASLAPHENGMLQMLAAVAGVEPAAPNATMEELKKMQPKRVGTVADYQKNVSKAAAGGLHRLLTHEILCLCDASVRHKLNLTGLQIFETVFAQAEIAGRWYYGTVTPEQTLQFLQSAEKAGLISLK